MQLRNKIAVMRNFRIRHLSLLNAKYKTVVLSLEVAYGETTGKPIQLIFHGIRFVSKHLELLEHRATTSAGKPVSILHGIANKMLPFRPSW